MSFWTWLTTPAPDKNKELIDEIFDKKIIGISTKHNVFTRTSNTHFEGGYKIFCYFRIRTKSFTIYKHEIELGYYDSLYSDDITDYIMEKIQKKDMSNLS